LGTHIQKITKIVGLSFEAGVGKFFSTPISPILVPGSWFFGPLEI